MGKQLLVAMALALLPNLSGAAPVPTARLLISNPTPFVGEEVILTLELRSAPRPGAATPRWPDLAAFAASELPLPAPRRESGAEGEVLVQTVRQALLPLAPGAVTLDGAGIQLGDNFLAAAPLALRVRPLPASGRPEHFTGAVGAVGMELAADGRGNREIVVTLTGSAPLAELPPPRAIPGRGERLVPLGDTTSGTAPGVRQRTLRYLYLPGAGEVGGLRLELPLFDPGSERYRTLRATVETEHTILMLGLGGGIGGMILLGALAQRRQPRPPLLHRTLERLLGESPAGLQRSHILTRLAARGLPPALLSELESYWRQEDQKCFAPTAAIAPATAGESARHLARRLGKAVDKRRRFP